MDNAVALVEAYLRVRLVAFGASVGPSPTRACHVVTMGHVVASLRTYLRANWRVLRHVHFRDPAFGFLLTIEKALGPHAGGAGRGT